MRNNCEVFVEVDPVKMMYSGVPLRESTNKVILSEGIDGVVGPEFFFKVTDRNGKLLVDKEIEIFVKIEGTDVFLVSFIVDGETVESIEVTDDLLEATAELVRRHDKHLTRTMSLLMSEETSQLVKNRFKEAYEKSDDKRIFARTLIEEGEKEKRTGNLVKLFK